MIGQGIVLMVAGMGIVYAFLYLLIVVSELASRFVSRFDYIVADCEQKRQPNKHRPQPEIQNAVPTKTEGTPVAAPVPGTVVPRMPVQMVLASQVSVLQMTGPRMMAQAILACQSHIWLSW